MATAAPTQELPLFYNKLEALNAGQHGNMKIRRIESAIPYPCRGPRSRVLRISMSSVPGKSSVRFVMEPIYRLSMGR